MLISEGRIEAFNPLAAKPHPPATLKHQTYIWGEVVMLKNWVFVEIEER